MRWMKALNGGLLAGMALLLLAGGLYLFSTYDSHRRQVDQDLLTVAQFKTSQVSAWYQERRNDARILATTLSLWPAAASAVGAGEVADRPEDSNPVGAYLRSFAETYQYADVLLLDAQGGICLGLETRDTQVMPHQRELLREALTTGRLMLDDLHLDGRYAFPHYCLLAPFHGAGRADGPAVGAVLLVVDARSFLYPLMRSWPRPSRSAECLLVRQEGDSVVYLSELKTSMREDLGFALPIDTPDLPAAMAARGVQGVHRGKDYRGVQVLSALMPVEGTPWFLEAKLDQSEADASLRLTSQLALLLILTLLALLGAGLVALRQRDRQRHLATRLTLESRLLQTALRHQVVLENIAEGVLSVDPQGRVEWMNREAERLLGITQDNALGQPLVQVLQLLEGQNPCADPLALALAGKLSSIAAPELLLMTRDGRKVPVSCGASPLRDPTLGALGSVLTLRDQSASRESLQRLRESEARFRVTFEQTAVGISHTAPDGTMMRVNQRLADIVGRNREELLNDSFRSITHPDDLAQDQFRVNRLLGGERVADSWEKRYVRKDGGVVWVDLNTTLIRDAQGRPEYFLTVVQDNTRRKLQEEQNTLLRSAMEQAAESVVVTDAEANIVYVNPAFERISGYAREEVLGHNPRLLKSGQLAPEFYEDMWRRLQSGEVFEGRFVNRRKDGSISISQASISRVLDAQGRLTHYVAVMRDITVEDTLQGQLRQSQKMEAVGRLASGVTHDFNNILQAILGYGHMLRGLLKPEGEEAECVVEILHGAERAASLTKQLLAFSRKQAITHDCWI